MDFCSALESVSSLIAIEDEWSHVAGGSFASFKALCLQATAHQVRHVPRPGPCGWDHLWVPWHGVAAVDFCSRERETCPEVSVHPARLTVLEVSTLRLGRALCQALGLANRHQKLPMPRTFQFGAWSSAAVPAILTIQSQRIAFQGVVAQLAASLRVPFILFAPTPDFMDATCLAALRGCGAAFFALNAFVTLTEQGTLKSKVAPGELFGAFTPQPREADMDVAVRAFALVRNLDTDKALHPPSLLTVFRLYCIEELSYAQIGRRCKCTKTTIVRRMAMLRRRTGLDLLELRRLSPHLAELEDQLHDDRAAGIRREAS